jgi:hypothetical protein
MSSIPAFQVSTTPTYQSISTTYLCPVSYTRGSSRSERNTGLNYGLNRHGEWEATPYLLGRTTMNRLTPNTLSDTILLAYQKAALLDLKARGRILEEIAYPVRYLTSTA